MIDWDYFDEIPEYHPIADANNLYDAFKSSRKGSHWKAQIQRFRWNLFSEIYKLQTELDNLQHGRENAYRLSEYSLFLVNERGKVRAITALKFRDRIVKHALNDVFLLPHLKPFLIYDNGASLKGKGVSFTRNRIITHLESYYRETGSNEGYIMTMDFSGYYDNIDHYEAMKMICKYESDEFARLLTWQAYDSYKIDVSYMSDAEFEKNKNKKFSIVDYRENHFGKGECIGEKFFDRSLSVGDQTSQITAIAFPTPIDKLVTIANGYKYYGRYMDDLYVIAKTRDELIELYGQIKEKADELKIFINPKKTKICKLSHTFEFLKFKYYLRDTGHVVVRINPKTIIRMKRKLKRMKTKNVKRSNVEEMFKSWIASYCGYMSKKQFNGIIDLFINLFGNNINEWLELKKLHSIIK